MACVAATPPLGRPDVVLVWPGRIERATEGRELPRHGLLKGARACLQVRHRAGRSLDHWRPRKQGGFAAESGSRQPRARRRRRSLGRMSAMAP